MTIGRLVDEPLRIHTTLSQTERRDRVEELLKMAQLPTTRLSSYPHEFSGGQLQRINIARALATEPDLLVLDEPTASLDAHTRRAVLDLLERLRTELGLTYLLISHDLGSVIRYCHRIVVLYRGRIMEEGTADAISRNAVHPYTKLLMDARMDLGESHRERRHDWTSAGVVADETAIRPSQCAYSFRCPLAIKACFEARPKLEQTTGHPVACIRAAEIVEGLHQAGDQDDD
jgi:oligopeptide/dipeptide ABC transporter ATP-binding protein